MSEAVFRSAAWGDTEGASLGCVTSGREEAVFAARRTRRRRRRVGDKANSDPGDRRSATVGTSPPQGALVTPSDEVDTLGSAGDGRGGETKGGFSEGVISAGTDGGRDSLKCIASVAGAVR